MVFPVPSPAPELTAFPGARLTCRKREVLLAGSQWNSTALSWEGSTWGSITPTDSGTSAGREARLSPHHPRGLSGETGAPRGPSRSPMSRMRSPGRLHRHPSSCCCSVCCRRRSWNTTRTTLCGHREGALVGVWEPVPRPAVGQPSPAPHLASRSQETWDSESLDLCPDAHLPFCETGEVI